MSEKKCALVRYLSMYCLLSIFFIGCQKDIADQSRKQKLGKDACNYFIYRYQRTDNSEPLFYLYPACYSNPFGMRDVEHDWLTFDELIDKVLSFKEDFSLYVYASGCAYDPYRQLSDLTKSEVDALRQRIEQNGLNIILDEHKFPHTDAKHFQRNESLNNLYCISGAVETVSSIEWDYLKMACSDKASFSYEPARKTLKEIKDPEELREIIYYCKYYYEAGLRFQQDWYVPSGTLMFKAVRREVPAQLARLNTERSTDRSMKILIELLDTFQWSGEDAYDIGEPITSCGMEILPYLEKYIANKKENNSEKIAFAMELVEHIKQGEIYSNEAGGGTDRKQLVRDK